MALRVKKRYPVLPKSRSHHTLPQRVHRKERRRHSLRRTASISLILSFLVVAGAIAYTWYTGKQQPAHVAEPLPTSSRRSVIKPPKIASNAPIGASVQTFTPEIKPGENASVTVRTNPEAECTIVVRYDNVLAVDSGLGPKVSDEFGVVSWAWTVSANAPHGTWPADVTCKNKKNSAFVRAEFVVK